MTVTFSFLADDPLEYSWDMDASCAETDAEIFFPDKGGSLTAGRIVCARCPVQQECLDNAFEVEQSLPNPSCDTHGIRAGWAASQRIKAYEEARARGVKAVAPRVA